MREAAVTADDHVLEVGPGLGSLTLAILETGASMTAVEIDPSLAERLPNTIAEFMPDAVERFRVINRDALTVSPENLPDFSGDDTCRITWPRRFCSPCWNDLTICIPSW